MLTLTGIQYRATDKNCDLIVQSCDFHNAFKTDSPGDWLVESRTCFGAALVYIGNGDDLKSKLQHCQGDCDADSDCAAGLKCFQRGAKEKVQGCLVDIGETL